MSIINIKFNGSTDPDILTGVSGGPTPPGLVPDKNHPRANPPVPSGERFVGTLPPTPGSPLGTVITEADADRLERERLVAAQILANRTGVPPVKVGDAVTGRVSAGGAVTSGFVNADGKTLEQSHLDADQKLAEDRASEARRSKDALADKFRKEAKVQPSVAVIEQFALASQAIGSGQLLRYLAEGAKAKGDAAVAYGNSNPPKVAWLKSGAEWLAAEQTFLDAAALFGQPAGGVPLSLDHLKAFMFAAGPVSTAFAVKTAINGTWTGTEAVPDLADAINNLPGDMADNTTIN